MQTDKFHLASKGVNSFNRWIKGVSEMMENKQGVHEVNKLKALMLMGVDFKFLNKLLIGVRTMNMAEKLKFIPVYWYSRRKGNSSIEAGIHNNLFFGLRIIIMLNVGIVSYDAHT